MTLGDIILGYRAEHNLTMETFGKLCGLSKGYISMLEKNQNPKTKLPIAPSLDTYKAIARLVGIDYNTLIDAIGGCSAELLSDASPLDCFPAPNTTEKVISFPIITSVAAHYDCISSSESITGETIDIPEEYLRGRAHSDFCVMRVNGDSMFPNFHSGDLVLVLKQSVLNRAGEIGVVIYGNEEMTLKRVNFVAGEEWLELIPLNPSYPTKIIKGADLESCRIVGIPRLLIREF